MEEDIHVEIEEVINLAGILTVFKIVRTYFQVFKQKLY